MSKNLLHHHNINFEDDDLDYDEFEEPESITKFKDSEKVERQRHRNEKHKPDRHTSKREFE